MKRMEGSLLKRFVWAKKEVRAEKVKVAPNAGGDEEGYLPYFISLELMFR